MYVVAVGLFHSTNGRTTLLAFVYLLLCNESWYEIKPRYEVPKDEIILFLFKITLRHADLRDI